MATVPLSLVIGSQWEGQIEHTLENLAAQIRTAGERIGLPRIAACADVSHARPALDESGRPVNDMFDFTRDAPDYWQQSDLALKNFIVAVVRQTAEPFYYDGRDLGGWHTFAYEDLPPTFRDDPDYGVRAAIVAPVHLAGNTIGAVIWASEETQLNIREVFEKEAWTLHGLAMRFVAECNRLRDGNTPICLYDLSRREIQCLKLAAAGKTDSEIAQILGLARPTIRYHLKNASETLSETGRLRTVQRAAELGFVDTRLDYRSATIASS